MFLVLPALLGHALEELDGLGVLLQGHIGLLDFRRAAGGAALALDLAQGTDDVHLVHLHAVIGENAELDHCIIDKNGTIRAGGRLIGPETYPIVISKNVTI